jgi:hypothetical protein
MQPRNTTNSRFFPVTLPPSLSDVKMIGLNKMITHAEKINGSPQDANTALTKLQIKMLTFPFLRRASVIRFPMTYIIQM